MTFRIQHTYREPLTSGKKKKEEKTGKYNTQKFAENRRLSAIATIHTTSQQYPLFSPEVSSYLAQKAAPSSRSSSLSPLFTKTLGSTDSEPSAKTPSSVSDCDLNDSVDSLFRLTAETPSLCLYEYSSSSDSPIPDFSFELPKTSAPLPGKLSLCERRKMVLTQSDTAMKAMIEERHQSLPQEAGDPGLRALSSGRFPESTAQEVDAFLRLGAAFYSRVGGTSQSLEVTDENGNTVALFKSAKRELGTEWEQIVSGYQNIVSKDGIPPGAGAFREHLADLYISTFLAKASVESSQLAVPTTAYVTCGSTALFKTLGEERQPVCVIEEGSLHQFETGSRTLKAFEENLEAQVDTNPVDAFFGQFDTDLVQKIAILDLILLNSDRNSGNVMIQEKEGQAPRLLLIDHAAILPANAASAGRFCWLKAAELKRPLSAENRQLIQALTPQDLSDLLSKLASQGIARASSFDPNSLESHALAIELLQQGLKKDYLYMK